MTIPPSRCCTVLRSPLTPSAPGAMGAHLFVLPGADEVAGVDGGRRQGQCGCCGNRGAAARPLRSRRGSPRRQDRASSRRRPGGRRGCGRARSGSPVHGRRLPSRILSTARSKRRVCAWRVLTKPQSRLSRSSASWAPSALRSARGCGPPARWWPGLRPRPRRCGCRSRPARDGIIDHLYGGCEVVLNLNGLKPLPSPCRADVTDDRKDQ